MIKKIYIFFVIANLVYLSSCAELKRGLTGQKKRSTDEFLVKKKAPLVLPPKFNELPFPKEEKILRNNSEKSEVKEIFNLKKKIVKSKTSKNTELEKSVLKKISD